MTHEIYHRYRPSKLEDVVGQANALSVINKFISEGKIPHAMMFIGPPGTGKTTLARILSKLLKCGRMDFDEVNCASIESPIDKIRSIQTMMGLSPASGPVRVWLLDEIQALSKAGFAQQALLKMLEEPPKTVYFFLATTDPNKVIKAIRSRCTEIVLRAIPDKELAKLLKDIVKKEKADVTDDVIDKVISVAEGSARNALKILDSVLKLETEEKQLEAVQSGTYERQSIELCRALLSPKCSWPEVARILQGIDEEPETMRRMILGYMSAVMLKGGKNLDRVHSVMKCMEFNFFDTGKPGLVSACYQAVIGT